MASKMKTFILSTQVQKYLILFAWLHLHRFRRNFYFRRAFLHKITQRLLCFVFTWLEHFFVCFWVSFQFDGVIDKPWIAVCNWSEKRKRKLSKWRLARPYNGIHQCLIWVGNGRTVEKLCRASRWADVHDSVLRLTLVCVAATTRSLRIYFKQQSVLCSDKQTNWLVLLFYFPSARCSLTIAVVSEKIVVRDQTSVSTEIESKSSNCKDIRFFSFFLDFQYTRKKENK